VIDLLRIIRGSICITVARRKLKNEEKPQPEETNLDHMQNEQTQVQKPREE
jgi:hypothetical protein